MLERQQPSPKGLYLEGNWQSGAVIVLRRHLSPKLSPPAADLKHRAQAYFPKHRHAFTYTYCSAIFSPALAIFLFLNIIFMVTAVVFSFQTTFSGSSEEFLISTHSLFILLSRFGSNPGGSKARKPHASKINNIMSSEQQWPQLPW